MEEKHTCTARTRAGRGGESSSHLDQERSARPHGHQDLGRSCGGRSLGTGMITGGVQGEAKGTLGLLIRATPNEVSWTSCLRSLSPCSSDMNANEA